VAQCLPSFRRLSARAPRPPLAARRAAADRIRVALAAVISALVVASCAAPRAAPGAEPPSVPPPAASAPGAARGAPAAATAPPAPMRLRMAYTAVSGAQLPAWVALDGGLFTQYGVDAELSYIATSQTAMGALLSNEVDMLSGAAEAAMYVFVEGGDAVAVGGYLNKVVQALYVAPAIAEPSHLRGKVVGVTRLSALSGSSARYLLRGWGLDHERDVSLIQTGGFPETLGAIAAGAIDGAVVPPPQTLGAKDLGFHELASLWTTPLEYPGSGVTMLRPRGPEREELTRRTIRAIAEATYRIKTDRPLAVRSLQTGTRTEDQRAIEEAYEVYAPLFERDLRLSHEAFRTAFEELAHNNPRAASADPASFMDGRFVDELRQSGLVDRLYGP
jgi:NitT/TauT family transport system substrate-binding protein